MISFEILLDGMGCSYVNPFFFDFKPLLKINCNDEHARRICIKLFTEGKIERKKIKGEYGRPFYRYYFD